MHIPSPSISGFHIGPLEIHFYALMYLVGIALAIWITRRRWSGQGRRPRPGRRRGDLVGPGGDHRRPDLLRHHHARRHPARVVRGVRRVERRPGHLGRHRPGRRGGRLAGAPGRARAWQCSWTPWRPRCWSPRRIGRIGNYFNKELFGKPTSLPWGLEIPYGFRPPGYRQYSTFQPSFLYELIFDLLLAAALVWLGHHRRIKPPGLFALYVAGYSAYRIFEETIRIDSSEHFLGLRLNMYIAIALTLIGWAGSPGRSSRGEHSRRRAWRAAQRRPRRHRPIGPTGRRRPARWARAMPRPTAQNPITGRPRRPRRARPTDRRCRRPVTGTPCWRPGWPG